MYDIIIAGSGPAGCMAAIGAKQIDPNLRVLVIDKRNNCKNKIGEALLTGTIYCLDEAGLLSEFEKEGFHLKTGAAYKWGKSKSPWHVNYEYRDDYPESFSHDKGRYAVHVHRPAFESFLKTASESRGVDFSYSYINSVSVKNDKILGLKTTDEIFRSKYFIDATGQASLFSASGITNRRQIWNPKKAWFGWTTGLNWQKAKEAGFSINRTNIIATKDGWCWVIHLGEKGHNLTSIGFVSAKKGKPAWSDFPEVCPELSTDFGWQKNQPLYDSSKTVIDNCLTLGDWSYNIDRYSGSNWAITGDASMFLDPILSQGVTLACHYGYLRGRVAAMKLAGFTDIQDKISQHQINEGEVLKSTIEDWYMAEPDEIIWHQNVLNEAKKISNDSIDRESAFRWITNLENLRKEYAPFSIEQEKILKKQLKCKRG